ncbi:MAG: ATP synthase F1 subunit gamma [Flavobacteriaceae bacterium]|nr:ATP synthase F1 subunit gamma [Flavobacteriaceae bacterium]
MANLKEIRGRITSISSTMQITSAMKMVSAAKLKKAQDAITMLRPYSEKLQELIEKVSTGEGNLSEYAQKREVKKILYIAISSNRGLAGAFNSSVIKELNANYKENEEVEIEVLTVGKKVFDSIRKTKTVYSNQSSIYDSLSFEAIAKLTNGVMSDFKEEKFDEVYLVYNQFVNAATQRVITEKLLPITMPERAEEETESDYIFEPNKETILETLIPKSIKTQVYKAVLDSIASEHGARMTAMHKATDNAKALKNELVIFYNKARQAAITNEILEIVSGAEALKKG